jgi:hypothetical protein
VVAGFFAPDRCSPDRSAIKVREANKPLAVFDLLEAHEMIFWVVSRLPPVTSRSRNGPQEGRFLSWIHFILALPRSRSALLAANLRQTPRFHAGMTSPMRSIVTARLRQMNQDNETAVRERSELWAIPDLAGV